ncbi:MAG: helix-turn-helix transcriptional regulator [Pseudomonadota bacterium]|jgi:transcriptional regulator with XRE-family HTH domain
MADFLEQWANKDHANAKLAAQEALITEVTEAIWKAMEEVGMNKAELAKNMEATKGYVSQILNGSRNMTLRTLADICFALGYMPSFRLEPRKTATNHEDTDQVS